MSIPALILAPQVKTALVKLSSLRSGVLRMSARELQAELDTARAEMAKHFRK